MIVYFEDHVLTNDTHCNHIGIFCCVIATAVISYRSAVFLGRKRGTMLGAREQRSEVARLLEQISVEYEAAQRGLSGFAYGASQHEFITARMENMGRIHSQLHSLVGDAAIAMIAEQLNDIC